MPSTREVSSHMETLCCTKEGDSWGKFCNRRGKKKKGSLGHSSEVLARGLRLGFILHEKTRDVPASFPLCAAHGPSSPLLQLRTSSMTSCPRTSTWEQGERKRIPILLFFLAIWQQNQDTIKLIWALWQVWVTYQWWGQTCSERSWGAEPSLPLGSRKFNFS